MLKRTALIVALLSLLFWQPVRAETRKVIALSAVTTGTSPVYALNNVDTVGISVAWTTGSSAGVVVLETAPTSDYAGTWSVISSLSVPASPPAVTDDARQVAAHYCRVRVSTTVSGGTITAYVFLQSTAR